MDYRKFTKKELVDILELVQGSVKSTTEDDLVKVTGKLKDIVSADHGVCGLGEVSSNRLRGIIKIVNLDYPGEWLSMYARENLFTSDPIIRFNYEHYRTHLWTEALDIYGDAPYRDFMNKASEFGLRYGVAGGISGDGNRKGSIFSFSSSVNRFSAHQRDILDIVTPHVHQALVRVCGGVKASPRDGLSEREKEVLRWMKEGKTNWEISAILKISERTVKFHVQNIERKLNAVNKAHAIAIAMDGGLVS